MASPTRWTWVWVNSESWWWIGRPGVLQFFLDPPKCICTLLQTGLFFMSQASILWHSAFFMVQLSEPYMTTGKTIALTRQSFVGKVISLLFNMLSKLVITFLSRSKHLLISWLQSPSAVILEPIKISLTLFPHLFPMKWWDQMPWS